MKTWIARIFTLALVFMLTNQIALSQFSLTGEIRPRGEYRNGFKTPRISGADPAIFIEQRSRLYVDFAKEKMAMHLSLQDVRIWGSVDQIYKTDPNLQNVFEAWAQYNFNEKIGMKMGRMALDYDGARFLGDLAWAQQSRSHDAIMFKHEMKEQQIFIHLGGAYNQNPSFEPRNLNYSFYDDSVKNYKTMLFLWGQKKWEKGAVSLMAHSDGRQVQKDSSMAYRGTIGTRAHKEHSKFEVGIEAYYQFGYNQKAQEVSAYMGSLYAKFKTKLTPITIGGDYLSGTEKNKVDDGSFAPLYGTNHKFYGFMDYFYVGNAHKQGSEASSGLMDLFLKTKFGISKKMFLIAHYHYFSSPVTIIDPVDITQNLSSYLGSEIDLVYLIKLQDDFKIHLGYSQMFATESMLAVKKNSGVLNGNQWAWIMVTFKPQLFTTAQK